METRIMHLFTRTPMHVGAGSSVGAIDLPVVRERHTRAPVIPGSSLKGVIADLYEPVQIGGSKYKRGSVAEWLFGKEDAGDAAAGALMVGEGRLVAFPLRSAANAFAWITCPFTLSRYARDTRTGFSIPTLPSDESCLAVVPVRADSGRVVLEEYCFTVAGGVPDEALDLIRAAMEDDIVWSQLDQHLVIVSDGMFSFFVESACQIATRIRIDNFTGTVAQGALFDQENVPSECLFYSIIAAQRGRGEEHSSKGSADALAELAKTLEENANVLQIGGGETTGLGWCSVNLKETVR